jgi:hypothetical protein
MLPSRHSRRRRRRSAAGGSRAQQARGPRSGPRCSFPSRAAGEDQQAGVAGQVELAADAAGIAAPGVEDVHVTPSGWMAMFWTPASTRRSAMWRLAATTLSNRRSTSTRRLRAGASAHSPKWIAAWAEGSPWRSPRPGTPSRWPASWAARPGPKGRPPHQVGAQGDQLGGPFADAGGPAVARAEGILTEPTVTRPRPSSAVRAPGTTRVCLRSGPRLGDPGALGGEVALSPPRSGGA